MVEGMNWPDLFQRGEKEAVNGQAEKKSYLRSSFTFQGVIYNSSLPSSDWLSHPLAYAEQADLAAFLAQLEEEAFAQFSDGRLFLHWDEVYRLLNSSHH